MRRPRLEFWDNVLKGAPDACWPWLGFKKPTGHGLTSMQSMPMHAHRKAWVLTHGPIRDGLCVNHKCDNAVCCNPKHLYLGTRADNMIDLWGKTAPDERTARDRRSVLSSEQLAEMRRMRREGATLKECAARFGVHFTTICRYITAHRKVLLAKSRADRLSRL